jgi:hypothetical protein|tara:strand:- start:426 stop:578 length:153 start_codon:yes stop_codon:yes gene_type:complete
MRREEKRMREKREEIRRKSVPGTDGTWYHTAVCGFIRESISLWFYCVILG